MLYFETKLEEIGAKRSSCESPNSGPVLEKEVDQSSGLLDVRVSNPPNKGESIIFDEPGVI